MNFDSSGSNSPYRGQQGATIDPVTEQPLPKNLAEAQAFLMRKFQELETREHRVSDMLANIRDWESRTGNMNLRMESTEAETKDPTQQPNVADRFVVAAQNGSIRNSPFNQIPEIDAFVPQADSSMRSVPESQPTQEIIGRKGKEREQSLPMDDQEQYADDEDTDEEEIDAVMNELQATSTAYFPLNFPRSIIGAGPALKLKTTTCQKNNAGTPSTSQFGRTIEVNMNIAGGSTQKPNSSLEQAIVALTGCVTRLTEHMSHLSPPGVDREHAQRKKKYGGKRAPFRLPPKRHTAPERTDQLRVVREIMNAMFNIKHDNDIIEANPADENAITAYEGECGPGPMPPYAPSWGHIECPWNYALLEVFMENYTAKYILRDQEQQEDICKMFMDRLRRLKKKVRHATPRNGESKVQMDQRLWTEHRRVLANQRRNSRRNERYAVRSRITVQNAASQKGDGQVIWEHLDDILATLGAGAMSSDESDVDNDGRSVYFAKKLSWRRPALVARMITVDRDRNFKNCYENITGSAPRP